jgi:transcriptional regulator with XRE-family HTH domain
MTVMPVAPDLIIWAREFRGLELQEAAKLFGITAAELEQFERGGKPLHLAMFRKISGALRIPGATLLRRTRPSIPAMPHDYRSISGRGARIGLQTRFAIDYARTIASNIRELVESGIGPTTPVLPHLTRNEDAAEAGERERDSLGHSDTESNCLACEGILQQLACNYRTDWLFRSFAKIRSGGMQRLRPV